MVTSVDGAYCPSTGDFIDLNLSPTKGHEQSGKRPALVVSPFTYNQKTGLCLAFPITGAVKGYPFEVTIPNDLGVYGVVLADQCGCRSWTERKAKFLGKAPATLVADVTAKFKTLLP